MNKELEPCPHCGNKKVVMTDTTTEQLLPSSTSVLSLVQCRADLGGCGASSGWFETDDEAAESWNKRVTPEPVYYRYRHSINEKWQYGGDPQSLWECQALGVIPRKGD